MMAMKNIEDIDFDIIFKGCEPRELFTDEEFEFLCDLLARNERLRMEKITFQQAQIKADKILTPLFLDVKHLKLVNSELNLKAIKDELLNTETLTMMNSSQLILPVNAKVLFPIKHLHLQNNQFASINKRCPNLESLRVIEDQFQKSYTLSLGKPTDKFKQMKEVYIDKSSTWSSIDTISNRVEQFDNVGKVFMKFKVFDETLKTIRDYIPHDVLKYERIRKTSKHHN